MMDTMMYSLVCDVHVHVDAMKKNKLYIYWSSNIRNIISISFTVVCLILPRRRG